jgi:hypothetical protein
MDASDTLKASDLDSSVHRDRTVTFPDPAIDGQRLTGRLLATAQWTGGMRANGVTEGPRTTITVLPAGAARCTSRTIPAATPVDLAG